MIKIDNLIKEYGDFCLEVSMDIPEGTVTGIVGKNGAGKSSLIKAVLGLIKPDSGSVRVFGVEARHQSEADKRRTGAALADSGFSGWLNVEAVVRILDKMYDSFDRKGFEKSCADMGIPMKKDIRHFSTGMKAKLRVLTALTHEARLLVLDEPTAGLDVETRIAILDMLRQYIAEDERRTIIITSHIAGDLEGVCDDIYLIDEGKIILHEETDRILSSYGVMKVTESVFEEMDREYITGIRKEKFGYSCLTNEKQYYMDNYPDIVIENAGIDDIIMIAAGGERA